MAQSPAEILSELLTLQLLLHELEVTHDPGAFTAVVKLISARLLLRKLALSYPETAFVEIETAITKHLQLSPQQLAERLMASGKWWMAWSKVKSILLTDDQLGVGRRICDCVPEGADGDCVEALNQILGVDRRCGQSVGTRKTSYSATIITGDMSANLSIFFLVIDRDSL
jgi:hypothetical protein